MDPSLLAQGLLQYIFFIPLLTFHEWAHAWTAWKCGDDTAYNQGRVSLNPIVHMEFIGTVVLPLAGIFLGVMGSGLAAFIIGWGRPVPVNLHNLSKPRWHDTLISMAGPAMNVVLAVVLLVIAGISAPLGYEPLEEIADRMALLSLFLCFFNLLPIPPLDGSHPMQHLIGMSYETYYRIAQFGFILVIVAIQIPPIRYAIAVATVVTHRAITNLVG